MFTRTKATTQRRIQALQRGVDEATADRDAARSVVDGLAAQAADREAVLAQADAGLQQANAALATAQGTLDAALAGQAAARDRVDRAEGALERHRENGPNLADHNDIREWRQRLLELQAALKEAQRQLQAADDAVGPAQAARDGAQAAVAAAAEARNAALAARDRAAAELAAAQGRLQSAEATLARLLDELRDRLPTLTARLADLQAREDAIAAEPLDRPGLERVADLELAELLDSRRQRHQLLGRRAAAAAVRASRLGAQDLTVDDLARLRADVAAWPDTPRWPALADLLVAVDGVVAASLAQRALPPAGRTDDLVGARATLTTQLATLEVVLAQATGERDTAKAAVQAAADALAKHQQEV